MSKVVRCTLKGRGELERSALPPRRTGRSRSKLVSRSRVRLMGTEGASLPIAVGAREAAITSREDGRVDGTSKRRSAYVGGGVGLWVMRPLSKWRGEINLYPVKISLCHYLSRTYYVVLPRIALAAPRAELFRFYFFSSNVVIVF